MDAKARKARRDPEKEKFWRGALRDAEASGKSVREFCAERGLKENMFYAWRRELKLRDAECKEETGFVELVARASSRSDSGVSIRLDNGLSILVNRGFDAQTLKATLAAVVGVQGQ